MLKEFQQEGFAQMVMRVVAAQKLNFRGQEGEMLDDSISIPIVIHDNFLHGSWLVVTSATAILVETAANLLSAQLVQSCHWGRLE